MINDFVRRGALPNGTLWLGSFSAAQYRSDVHAAVYRCKASNTVGTVLSRDMRIDAGMFCMISIVLTFE